MNPSVNAPQLRDIHLPDPVSWWPPAPGWWLLPALLLCVSILIYFVRRRRKRYALVRQARQALVEISIAYRQSGDVRTLAQELSVLLRRVSLSRYPREAVAGLTGDAWLAWLDRTMSGNEFRQGAGSVLARAPYSGNATGDGDALLQLCERWILRLPEAEGPRS